jgi:hypothetical protein
LASPETLRTWEIIKSHVTDCADSVSFVRPTDTPAGCEAAFMLGFFGSVRDELAALYLSDVSTISAVYFGSMKPTGFNAVMREERSPFAVSETRAVPSP